MSNSRFRKRWIKLWTQESLFGSITKELDPAERWCWIGALLLAGDSPDPGKLLAAPGIPWTDQQIAKILAVPLELWLRAKEKMVKHDKIVINSDVISVVNWERYQSRREDYMREYMRKHRQKGKAQDDINLTEENDANLTCKPNSQQVNNKPDNVNLTCKPNTLADIKEEEENRGEQRRAEENRREFNTLPYGSGPSGPFGPPGTFGEWVEKLEEQPDRSKKIGVLVEAFRAFHSQAPPEDFRVLGERLGRMSKGGNEKYVLKLILDSAEFEILGSHLDYIQRMKSGARERDGPKLMRLPTSEEIYESFARRRDGGVKPNSEENRARPRRDRGGG